MDIDNAFAELGLTPDATDIEVKAAWRRLVSQWHPDRNDSAAAVAKMQRINRAAEAIRQAGFSAPRAEAGTDSTGPVPPAGPGSAAAPTIRRKVKLTLEEAAAGCTKVLQGQTTALCLACAGAGFQRPGGHCPDCQGSGAVRQRAWYGWTGSATECEACHGSGQARAPCVACAGSGQASRQRYRLSVRFPPGVRDGDQLSVAGGSGKPGAPPGDLGIRVGVLAHAFFKLGADGTVTCEMPVDGFAWIANRPLEVPTLYGLLTLTLPREQLSHRLKGHGFPVEPRGPRGDQLLTVVPVFPPRLSTDQQILLDQLIATTAGPGARPSDDRLGAWLQSLRAWKQRQPGRA